MVEEGRYARDMIGASILRPRARILSANRIDRYVPPAAERLRRIRTIAGWLKC